MQALTTTAQVLTVTGPPLLAGLDAQGLTTAATAGVALSHAIQPYMKLVPSALKPLIPIVTAIGGSVATCMGQGMGFKDAMHYGVVTAVAALVNHALTFAKPTASAAPTA